MPCQENILRFYYGLYHKLVYVYSSYKSKRTMEKQLTQKESLEIIHAMVQQSRQRVGENGVFYLLWGYAALIAALAHYLLLQAGIQNPWMSWVLMPVAGVLSGIIGYRKSQQATVLTHVDTAMVYLWGAFLIVLITVLSFSGQIGFTGSYPVVILLYGLGTFVSGGILRFKPLIFGGIICWICGIAAMFSAFDVQLLLMAGAILCGYIVPGHLLYAQRND
jgi:hypothetical protein